MELQGRLYVSSSGYLLLSVPNSLSIGAFRSLPVIGIELPKFNGKFSAHLTVATSKEIESIGGPAKVTERGKSFHYSLGGIRELPAARSDENYSMYWIFDVSSPELTELRKTYGLPGSPDIPFHISVAARKRRVLYENSISKLARAGERGILWRSRLVRLSE